MSQNFSFCSLILILWGKMTKSSSFFRLFHICKTYWYIATSLSFPGFTPTPPIFEIFQIYTKEESLVEWDTLSPLLWMYPLPSFNNYQPMLLLYWWLNKYFLCTRCCTSFWSYGKGLILRSSHSSGEENFKIN